MVQYCPKNCCFVKIGCSLTKSVQNSLLGILLVHFCPYFNIQTLFLALFVNRMDKTEKSSKMLGNFLVDFLPILYPKVKNYFGLSIRHPLATIDVIQLNVPALKSQFENLFGHYSTIQITVLCVVVSQKEEICKCKLFALTLLGQLLLSKLYD